MKLKYEQAVVRGCKILGEKIINNYVRSKCLSWLDN